MFDLSLAYYKLSGLTRSQPPGARLLYLHHNISETACYILVKQHVTGGFVNEALSGQVFLQKTAIASTLCYQVYNEDHDLLEVTFFWL